jgi:hypothetical protein
LFEFSEEWRPKLLLDLSGPRCIRSVTLSTSAEAAAVTCLKSSPEQAAQFTRQAFEQETQAAVLIASTLDAEPTRSVLHRSAASLAIECGELQVAERLIATALSGNPPLEIAEELKDLFIQINLSQYLKRKGIHLDLNELGGLVNR